MPWNPRISGVLIFAFVVTSHAGAIIAVLRSDAAVSSTPRASLIQATLRPGPPDLAAPKEKATAKPSVNPKVVKNKPQPKARPIAALPSAAAAIEPTPQTVASPQDLAEGSEGATAAEGDEADAPLLEARSDYLKNPSPKYPALSRRLGEQGRVQCRVLVDAEGKVKEIQLHQSSGFKRLDQAAMEAVGAWTFVPARRGERPVETWVIVPIVFNLKG